MALVATTGDASALWTAFKKAVADDDGPIRTWTFHSDGVHFTHTSEQWKRKAWFKPSVSDGVLVFNIVRSKGENITTEVYAEYHGLLTRVLLHHFDKHFTNILVTALASTGDVIADTA